MKAASAQYDTIPIMYLGIVKMYAGDTMDEDDVLQNDATGTFVLPIPTYTSGQMVIWRGLNNTGTRFRLGMSLNGAVTGDEILVLVGRTP